MNFQHNIAWYYVGVMALLLLGQNVVMGNAQKDAIAKLNAKHEQQLAAAGIAPAATPAPAPAVMASNAAPVSTLVAAPAVAPTPVAVAAKPAPEAAPAAKEPAPKPIIASAAPAKATAGKALPVAFAFRSEPFNKGKIVTLTNTSKAKLDCKLNVRRPSTGESKEFKVTVAAAGEARVKGEQGWSFKSGDQIEVAQAGYKSKTASIP